MRVNLSFVHFSEPHIQAEADEAVNNWGIRSYSLMERAIQHVIESGLLPDFFIITGDLADRHRDARRAYQRYMTLADEIHQHFQVPVLHTLGNHDHRAVFRQVMLGDESAEGEDQPYYYSQLIGDLRVVGLDTLIPGLHHGELDQVQLAWLREILESMPDMPTLIALHHPPIDAVMQGFAGDLLHNVAELEAIIIDRTNIIGIVCGHVHHHNTGLFGGVLCTASAGLSFTVDPLHLEHQRIMTGCGYSIVHVRDGQMFLNPVMLPGAPQEVARL